jgi:TolB-like protein
MSKLGIVVILVILGGCLSLPDLRLMTAGKKEVRVVEISYKAADHLHAQLRGGEAAGYPMLAASFVDSANLDTASDLGRLLSEQVASRLSQHGYSVAEIQLRADQLALGPTDGVLALSRDLRKVNLDVDAYSILVGTYTTIERQIYVNARVVRTSDGVALASSDFSLPLIRQRGPASAGAQPSVQTVLR